eukprot:11178685-Lingulodinium_polyedra.AAC.1
MRNSRGNAAKSVTIVAPAPSSALSSTAWSSAKIASWFAFVIYGICASWHIGTGHSLKYVPPCAYFPPSSASFCDRRTLLGPF